MNYQGGSYNDRTSIGVAGLAAQTYRLGKDQDRAARRHPRRLCERRRRLWDGKLRTALAPFGNNIYYSYQLFATPTNLIARGAELHLHAAEEGAR